MYSSDFDLNGWEDEMLDLGMGLSETIWDSTGVTDCMEDFEVDLGTSPFSEESASLQSASTCSSASVSPGLPVFAPNTTTTSTSSQFLSHFQLQHLAPQPAEPLADQPKATPPCEGCGREFKCLAGRMTHIKFCTGTDYEPTVRARKRAVKKEKKLLQTLAQQQHPHHDRRHHQGSSSAGAPIRSPGSSDSAPVPMARLSTRGDPFRGICGKPGGKRKKAQQDSYVTDAHMAWIADSLANLPAKPAPALAPLPGMAVMTPPPSQGKSVPSGFSDFLFPLA